MTSSAGLNRTARYNVLARFFHWALAALLPVQLGLGWYLMYIEADPGSDWYSALHISLGLTAALLIVLRILWRLRRPPPLQAAGLGLWQARAARAGHGLMYGLMVLLPLTGYVGAAFGGEAMGFFGLPLPAWATKNEVLKEQLFAVHGFLAWALVVLIAVHVLAALKHRFIDKDDVFQRMGW